MPIPVHPISREDCLGNREKFAHEAKEANAHLESSRRAPAPNAVSTRHSVSNCAMSLPRLAPTDCRIVISLTRAPARPAADSRRSRTRPKAQRPRFPAGERRAPHRPGLSPSGWSQSAKRPRFAGDSSPEDFLQPLRKGGELGLSRSHAHAGLQSAIRREIGVGGIHKRPVGRKQPVLRRQRNIEIGTDKISSSPNPRGSTPTIVTGWPFSLIRAPRM